MCPVACPGRRVTAGIRRALDLVDPKAAAPPIAAPSMMATGSQLTVAVPTAPAIVPARGLGARHDRRSLANGKRLGAHPQPTSESAAERAGSYALLDARVTDQGPAAADCRTGRRSCEGRPHILRGAHRLPYAECFVRDRTRAARRADEEALGATRSRIGDGFVEADVAVPRLVHDRGGPGPGSTGQGRPPTTVAVATPSDVPPSPALLWHPPHLLWREA